MSYDIDFSFLDGDPYQRDAPGRDSGEYGGSTGTSGGPSSAGSPGDAAEVPARDMMRDQADAVRSADDDPAADRGASDPPAGEQDSAAELVDGTDPGGSGSTDDLDSDPATGAVPEHDDAVVAGESSTGPTASSKAFEAMLAGVGNLGGRGNRPFEASRTLSDAPFSWLAPNENVKVQLPAVLVQALRDQLTGTLVQVWAVPADQARAFAERRSQAGLVIAFIAAQLDLRVPVDEATAQTAAVYACSNPLLGQVVSQVHRLAAAQQNTTDAVARVRKVAVNTEAQVDNLERMTSWLLAERIGTGIARGKEHVVDVDLHDDRVHEMRLRVRAQAADERDRERRREGRRRA